MDRWWDEVVTQGVHPGDRGKAGYVPVIPGIGPLGQRGAGLRLNTDYTHIRFRPAELVPDPGQELPGEV